MPSQCQLSPQHSRLLCWAFVRLAYRPSETRNACGSRALPPHVNPPQVFFPARPFLEGQTPIIPTQLAMDDERTSPAKGKKKGATSTRKSLSCEYCDRPFARLEHLQRHLRTRLVTLNCPPDFLDRGKANRLLQLQIRKRSRFHVRFALDHLPEGK